MEDGNSLGNLIAQGVIILFVLLLLALFIRTGLMVGSVFFLAWTRRRDRAQPTDGTLPQTAPVPPAADSTRPTPAHEANPPLRVDPRA